MMIILGVICVIVLIVIIGKALPTLECIYHYTCVQFYILISTNSLSLPLLLHSLLQHLRRVAPTPV